jgi:hypothetical protein
MNRLKREIDGYPGSIGESIRLNAQEARAVREVLAKSAEPLHISAIAKATGITKLGELNRFVSDYLTDQTRETAMCYVEGRRGRKEFAGFQMTKHGLEMYKNVG